MRRLWHGPRRMASRAGNRTSWRIRRDHEFVSAEAGRLVEPLPLQAVQATQYRGGPQSQEEISKTHRALPSPDQISSRIGSRSSSKGIGRPPRSGTAVAGSMPRLWYKVAKTLWKEMGRSLTYAASLSVAPMTW